jgi:hypothetical protein
MDASKPPPAKEASHGFRFPINDGCWDDHLTGLPGAVKREVEQRPRRRPRGGPSLQSPAWNYLGHEKLKSNKLPTPYNRMELTK